MRFLILSLLLLIESLAYAQAAPETYQNAIGLMQQKKFSQAMDLFAETNETHPDSVSNLYNWGLAAYQIEKHGLALGLWRRALYLSAQFQPASQAIDFAKEQLSSSVFAPASAGSIEQLKSNVLRSLSLSHILLVHFLLFTFTGWLAIRYFSQRKKAMEAESEPPSITFVHIAFAALLIVSSFFLIVALDFKFEPRATVIVDNAALRTAPDEGANEVFSVLEGVEVIIDDVNKDWALVTYPGGMTGWIEVTKLFQNNGSSMW